VLELPKEYQYSLGLGYFLQTEHDLDQAIIYRFYNKKRLNSIAHFIGFIDYYDYPDVRKAFHTVYMQELGRDAFLHNVHPKLNDRNFKELLIFEMSYEWDFLKKRITDPTKERVHKHISSELTAYYPLSNEEAEKRIGDKRWPAHEPVPTK